MPAPLPPPPSRPQRPVLASFLLLLPFLLQQLLPYPPPPLLEPAPAPLAAAAALELQADEARDVHDVGAVLEERVHHAGGVGHVGEDDLVGGGQLYSVRCVCVCANVLL